MLYIFSVCMIIEFWYWFDSNASPVEVDPAKVFSRDALGRQTMSEKRKSHLDPKTSSFYQQIKIAKG